MVSLTGGDDGRKEGAGVLLSVAGRFVTGRGR